MLVANANANVNKKLSFKQNLLISLLHQGYILFKTVSFACYSIGVVDPHAPCLMTQPVTTLPCFATCRPEPEPQCTLEPHEGICLLSGKKKGKKK